jgi:hypothetical protein
MFGTLSLTATSNTSLLGTDLTAGNNPKTIILTSIPANTGTITIRNTSNGNEYILLANETLSFTTYNLTEIQYRVSVATQTLKYSIV